MCVWYQGVDLDREKEHGTLGKISCGIKLVINLQLVAGY